MSEAFRIQCCGSEHVTKHCPHCGKRLHPDGGLGALLAHVHRTALKYQLQADRWRELSQPKWAGQAQRNADRWNAWAVEFEQLLNERHGQTND